MTLSNQEVAQVFRDIATAMEVLGESSFKTQAYARAADTIASLPIPLSDYVEQKTIDDLPGVGPAISAKIEELLATGNMRFRERLREQVPDGVIDMVRIVSVGPKTARRLYDELGISSVTALEEAARNGRVRTLKGVGAKAEARILQALDLRAQTAGRSLLGEMLPLARELVTTARAAIPELLELEYAGSIRRAVPLVGNIDLVAAAHDVAAVMQAFVALPQIAQVEQHTERHVEVRLHNDKACSLRVVHPDTWGTAWVLRTGSAAHRSRLQTRAAERGLTLGDDALWRGNEMVVAPDEEFFYLLLGLFEIPPELREDWGEIEAAATRSLPFLIRPTDIFADLHTHTTWSDGHHSVTDMAMAAMKRHYARLAITDHSMYMGMVNGLDGARLRQQRQEIDAFNQKYGISLRVLQGIEVDILPDGSLALPDDELAQLDWVIASPHVSLAQPREAATNRLLRAIRNPHVDCIGHPTGRLLLRRPGADLDMDAILEAAAETGTVLEIDGAYERLDLDAEHVKQAVDMGVRLAVDSDAHSIGDFDAIEYGVLTARRGWATQEDVVNCEI